MVCCNLCISTDGYQEEMRVGNYSELQSKILELIQNYNPENHLQEMRQLSEQNLTVEICPSLSNKSGIRDFSCFGK